MTSKTTTPASLVKLSIIQPSTTTKHLSSNPKTWKYFPLRKTAKAFAISDLIMASSLLIFRFFVTTRIVTFPLFQLISATFYLLISCLAVHQVFTENVASFPVFLICYTMAICVNMMATLILGLQTFDMGLITDNCGDVEVCVPHVRPMALAGWTLVSISFSFLIANIFMLKTYWELNNRILDERDLGEAYQHSRQSRAHTQHYPLNYSHSYFTSSSTSTDSDIEAATGLKSSHQLSKIRTPQPKKSAKDIFTTEHDGINDNESIMRSKLQSSYYYTSDTSNGSTRSVSVTDYKSFQISPLDVKNNVLIS